ncbi:MAG: MurR/RpiR family transcriptional regulator [Bacillota bacterium]|nr:MurR/RpiR family transcriptional regulator [Bacillota bacterium]
MNRTLLQIKVLYKDMGKSEKKIADWIMDHPDALLPLSITELAEKSDSSEATIVRFAKRLGLSGYQELKISIAQENSKKVINQDVNVKDSCFEVFEKVSNDIYCSLEMTKKVIDKDMLDQAAKAILEARQIVIFGLGNSASIALDAGHKFFRAGCNAVPYSDNHMQVIAASHLSDTDLAIGISHSGSSKDIVDALKIAKENGAKTIAITNYGKSPIVKHSDIVLFTSSPETQYTILGLNSRIAALAIIDSLYSYIVCHKDAEALSAIQSVERSLQSKKY